MEIIPELIANEATLKDLYVDLIKAQSELKAALKDGENPHFKSTYATYNSVWEAVNGPLVKNGFAFYVLPSGGPSDFEFKGVLAHKSGEKITATIKCRNTGNMQGVGSLITYAKRYLLMCLTGVPTDDDKNDENGFDCDDDGNAAVNKPHNVPKNSPPPKPKEVKNFAPNKGNYKPRTIESIPQDYQGSQQFADTPLDVFDTTIPDDIFGEGSKELDHAIALKDLYDTVDQSGLTNDEVKKIINSTVGPNKRSTDLSLDEIKTVIKFVNVMKNK